MAASVLLRSYFDAEGLRVLMRGSSDLDQTQRQFALSAVYAGGSRSKAALAGVELPTVRDWIVAFNALGPEGLIGGKALMPARASTLSSGRRCVSWSGRNHC